MMNDEAPAPQPGPSRASEQAAAPSSRLAPAAVDPLAPIRAAPLDRPFVVAQLGQSLDGRIATVTGESRWINGEAALDHLHALRAEVDAVVVGIGTVDADDPQLNVRRVALPAGRSQPARVVIDPSARLRDGAKCLVAGDGARRIVVRAEGGGPALPPGVEVIVVPRAADGRLAPGGIVTRLFALGLHRLLIEGGAQTVSSCLDAGVVDRLHVLVAPVIIGSGKTGLDLRPEGRLAAARRPVTTVHVLADGDVLFDCDFSASRGKV
ncbi:MAG: RibD family protein [Hyphomicrobiaceae bacterium]|nr:RibD family protein [Hyphomicrobiaceae bacterium]